MMDTIKNMENFTFCCPKRMEEVHFVPNTPATDDCFVTAGESARECQDKFDKSCSTFFRSHPIFWHTTVKNLHVGITELPVHLLNWKAGSNTARPCKFKTNVWAIKQQWPSKIIIPNMVDMLATKLDLPISEDSQH